MDSLTLNVNVQQTVGVSTSNGSILLPTGFLQQINAGVSYNVLGDESGQIDVLHFQVYEVAAGTSEVINLLTDIANPSATSGSLDPFTTLTVFSIIMLDNADGSDPASSITVGNASSASQLFFGATNHTIKVVEAGSFAWLGEVGVARGGTNLQIYNNDLSNTATFALLLAGRTS